MNHLISWIVVGALYALLNVSLFAQEQSNCTIKYILPNSLIHKIDIELPQVLSAEDTQLYYKIFKLQNQRNFAAADKLISKLENKILLGYVYYERYESKYYKTKVAELKTWMVHYYNLPVAKDIYAFLQRKLGVKNIPNVPRPLLIGSITPVYTHKELYKEQEFPVYENLNAIKSVKPQKNRFTKQLDSYLKVGKTKLVKNLLVSYQNKKVLDSKTYAYYAAQLTMLYFLNGKDDLSLEWGEKVLKLHETLFPEVSIVLGLVNWRIGEYKQSLYFFNKVISNKHLYNSEIVSKASYWASRCNFKLHDFNNYYANLKLAANYYYNFYGILASEELGVSLDYSGSVYNLSENNINLLLHDTHMQRALALLQFGLVDKAEQELILYAKYKLSKQTNKVRQELTKILIYLAHKVPMPMLSIKLAGARGIYYGLGYLSYPIFYIGDSKEHLVDTLLILSIIRRESYFYSSATSKAGAIGLMQIMPQTAKMLINNVNPKKEIQNFHIKTILKNPTYNFKLGQQYIKLLLNNTISQGNLIYALACWNAGNLHVKKWLLEEFRLPHDQLFFIESIPFAESRNFVKNVLTDYWIYQLTIGAVPYGAIKLINNESPSYVDPSPDYINNITNFSYKPNLDDNLERTVEEDLELIDNHDIVTLSSI